MYLSLRFLGTSRITKELTIRIMKTLINSKMLLYTILGCFYFYLPEEEKKGGGWENKATSFLKFLLCSHFLLFTAVKIISNFYIFLFNLNHVFKDEIL